MPDSPLTQRDVEALRTTLDKLDRTIDSLRGFVETTYVRKDVLNPQLETIRDRLATHDGWFTWGVRIVLGVVIVGLLTLLFASGGAHGT